METPDRFLTVEDLAGYLDVPVAIIYTWRYRGKGPHGFRVGRHLRFRSSDIEQWITEQLAQSNRTMR